MASGDGRNRTHSRRIKKALEAKTPETAHQHCTKCGKLLLGELDSGQGRRRLFGSEVSSQSPSAGIGWG